MQAALANCQSNGLTDSGQAALFFYTYSLGSTTVGGRGQFPVNV